MKCLKCNGELIEAHRDFQPIRGAVKYWLKCLDCGEEWSKLKGFRRDRRNSNEWSNVTFVDNYNLFNKEANHG